jgi:hypothetical protein
MLRVLFYGNCQLYAIYKILSMPNNFIQTCVECFSTEINEEEFLKIIKFSDIIITQPIKENYREKQYLSSKYILDNKSTNSIVIFFDSCHFNFYYPDLTYKTLNNELLRNPHDYHYDKIIEYYNNNKKIEDYISEIVNNVNLYSKDYLETIANNSLKQLHNRYIKMTEDFSGGNIFYITTHDFIKNNYKKKLLFYSMNHPTKYVLHFICIEICKILNLKHNINLNIDPLNNVRCILYKSIQNNVDFDINNYDCYTNRLSTPYEISKLYFDTYNELFQGKII